MADVLQLAATSTGTYYALIRDRTGAIWNGAAFESYRSSAYGIYAGTVPYIQQDMGTYYTAAMPTVAGFTSGFYYFSSYKQSGGSPVENVDNLVGFGSDSWNAATGSFMTIDNETFTLDTQLWPPPSPSDLADDHTITVRQALWICTRLVGLTTTVRPGVLGWATPNGHIMAQVAMDDPVFPQNLTKAT
jgi:hypothetical protein